MADPRCLTPRLTPHPLAIHSQLFGDAPAPNLYHQDRQNISVSPTSSFFSMRSDTHPSSTSVHRVSGATDFLRN